MRDKGANKEPRSGSTGLKNCRQSRSALQDVGILVVEDEFIVAMDLEDFLASHGGLVVGPARTVEQALQLANRESFALAILDVHVADQDVFPVARLLSERNIPFLFHTGHADSETLRRDWPDSEVLIKPAPYDRLLALLVQMAERAQMTRH